MLSFDMIFVMAGGIFAQSDISSPYSRFGLGTMDKNRTNTIMQGMGGISNAMSDKYLLNNSNPASYAAMDSLTFLFDAGFYMKYVTYRTTDASEKGSNASFDYFDLGFGVTKWLKMGLGVAPYSNRAYSSTASFDFQYPYSIDYEGTGGLNKLYWASGFKIYKGFSLGFKLNYIFGNVTDETTLYYPDYIYFHNERRTINLNFSDLTFDLGLMYKQELNKDYTLTFGATYGLPADMHAHRNVFIRTMFKGYGTSTETPIDTILYTKGENVSVKYPQSIGAGFTFQKNERWLVGVDFNWSNWSAFTMNGVSDSLQNSWNIAVGGCYTPFNTTVSSYFRKVTYRAGFHYDQTFFNIYGTSINKYGVTFGLGLPIPRVMTSLNVAVEFGKMGTVKNNLIKESYFNISFGISLRDKWFVKRRYK
ncbi:MAG: outer membrane protein transport protein [Bacteroidales bacterium]|nr:outer membrane protein transport protein [Bacteroidales bacterium]